MTQPRKAKPRKPAPRAKASKPHRTLNIPLLRQVQAHILAEPRRLDMAMWVDPTDTEAPCGTAACISGWARVMTMTPTEKRAMAKLKLRRTGRYSLPADAVNLLFGEVPPEVAGAELLGIPASKATSVFVLHDWPEQFRSAWQAAYNNNFSKETTALLQAGVAAARIEHLIQTGQ